MNPEKRSKNSPQPHPTPSPNSLQTFHISRVSQQKSLSQKGIDDQLLFAEVRGGGSAVTL